MNREEFLERQSEATDEDVDIITEFINKDRDERLELGFTQAYKALL